MNNMNEMREKADKIKNDRLAQGLTAVQTPAEKARANPKSMRAAVNAKCFECAGDQRSEVTKCELTGCSLHSMRPWQGKQTDDDMYDIGDVLHGFRP